jgi:glycosyltransferase involved in cell wall biosynthesis
VATLTPMATKVRLPLPEAAVRPWSVMHATEDVRAVLELAEAQRALGMRPVLVTPAGYGSIELYLRTPQEEPAKISLLGAWNEVRQWRRSLLDCASTGTMDIVHAHSFSAGMAGVRNWPAVVYDVRGFVEADADEGHQWLARSLRVAEQFVLARAGAIVIHRPSLQDGLLERGAISDHIFVVPDAVAGLAPDEWAMLRDELRLAEDTVTFFAADVPLHDLDVLLSAFAQIVSEVETTVLLLEASDPASAVLRNKLAAAGITRAVRVLTPGHRARALRGADVVVAGTPERLGPNPAGLEAMRAGRALLAVDVPANRDVSPDGRGCLWYKHGDARDLVGRAAFLARNADFRRSLGANARALIAETRSAEAVARRYDAVYRHAFARRRDDSQQTSGHLQPLHAAF